MLVCSYSILVIYYTYLNRTKEYIMTLHNDWQSTSIQPDTHTMPKWTKVEAELGELFWFPSARKQQDYYTVHSALYELLVQTQFSEKDLVNQHEVRIIPCNIGGANRLQFIFRLYSSVTEQWEYYLLAYAEHAGEFPF